jgi:hypothetical protein
MASDASFSKVLRGLRNKDHVSQDEPPFPTAVAFYPKFDSNKRPDGAKDISVNFYDDEGAVARLRQDRTRVAFGIAVLPTRAIDEINLEPFCSQSLLLERCVDEQDPGNQYHGNIVYLAKLSREKIKVVAALLVTKSVGIIR